MMSLFLPILLPLIGTLIFRTKPFSRPIGLGLFSLFAISQFCLGAEIVLNAYHHAISTLSFGAWQAPFGIFLVGDELAGLAICASAFLFWCAGFSADETRLADFLAHLCMLASACALVVLSGDMGLMALGLGWMLFSVLGVQSTWKSIVELKHSGFNTVILAVFFLSVSAIFCYSVTGALNFAEIFESIKMIPTTIAVSLVGFFTLLSVLFACKHFPFFNLLSGHFDSGDFAMPLILLGSLSVCGLVLIHRMLHLLFPGQLAMTYLMFFIGLGSAIVLALYAVSEARSEASLSALALSRFGFVLAFLSGSTAQWHALAFLMFLELCLWLPCVILLINGHRNRVSTALYGFACATLLGLLPLSGFWLGGDILSLGSWQGSLIIGVYILHLILVALVLFKLWISHFMRAPEPNASPSFLAHILITPCLILLVALGVGYPYLKLKTMSMSDRAMNAERYSEAVYQLDSTR
ncbi:MAG: hypothetical protein O3A01_03165 [bacterium]|nr:hypothetical protein [bacterium]